MMDDRLSAPKADALPGCATPRAAVSLGNAAVDSKPCSPVRGNERQNKAGTGNGSPELSHNPTPTFATRADLEAWARDQLETFQRDAPYARNQVQLMLSVADRIRRVTLAHQHLPTPQKETSGDKD